jgi:hypothetical protein
MGEAISAVFNGVWQLFNLGIEIDGFYLKFWYIGAFYVLVTMIKNLIFQNTGGASERTGNGAKYKSKKGGDESD